jgi:proline dehydrogenase
MIDAEDYAFQKIVDEVTDQMMEKYNKSKAIVYNTLQMYRTDRLEFLKQSLERAKQNGYYLGIKLVRGAYMERERLRAIQNGYPSPIWPDKNSTDQAYDKAQAFCIENIDRISLFSGTHNEQSCFYLTQLMKEKGLPNNYPGISIAQLYGMSDNISFNLALSNYNIAKYIPYGPVRKVLPYLIRRAEENSSVAGQTDRELRLIRSELKRRKTGHRVNPQIPDVSISYETKG